MNKVRGRNIRDFSFSARAWFHGPVGRRVGGGGKARLAFTTFTRTCLNKKPALTLPGESDKVAYRLGTQ
jgi:hypothetical protein